MYSYYLINLYGQYGQIKIDNHKAINYTQNYGAVMQLSCFNDRNMLQFNHISKHTKATLINTASPPGDKTEKDKFSIDDGRLKTRYLCIRIFTVFRMSVNYNYEKLI